MESVITSTHIDRHNMRMSKEALEGMVLQIKGERAASLGIEHDITLPPLGKVVDAKIVPTDDGEYILVAISETFEGYEEVTLPDGEKAFLQKNIDDLRPFKIRESGKEDKMGIHFDPVNFESEDVLEGIIEELHGIVDFEESRYLRKSFIPDPQVIISLGKDIALYLAGKKVFDKVTEKFGEDIAKVYEAVKLSAYKMIKHALPKNRPITYVFSLSFEIEIELVAITNDVDRLLNSIAEEKLKEVIKIAEEMKELLGAEKVQFLLDGDGIWKFNYLLTVTGGVVGSRKSISKRAKAIELHKTKKLNTSNNEQD